MENPKEKIQFYENEGRVYENIFFDPHKNNMSVTLYEELNKLLVIEPKLGKYFVKRNKIYFFSHADYRNNYAIRESVRIYEKIYWDKIYLKKHKENLRNARHNYGLYVESVLSDKEKYFLSKIKTHEEDICNIREDIKLTFDEREKRHLYCRIASKNVYISDYKIKIKNIRDYVRLIPYKEYRAELQYKITRLEERINTKGSMLLNIIEIKKSLYGVNSYEGKLEYSYIEINEVGISMLEQLELTQEYYINELKKLFIKKSNVKDIEEFKEKKAKELVEEYTEDYIDYLNKQLPTDYEKYIKEQQERMMSMINNK